MGSGNTSGYSWGSTSQWSQLPTVPSNNTTTDANQAPQQPQSSQQQIQPSAPQNTPQSQSTYSLPVPNPETRRDMISRLYKEILGRDADTAGLNYYLFNSNITESQIAKEMYESTEHQDILNKAKDVRQMVLKLETNSREVNELNTKLQNAESLANSYKTLVDQKTQIINSMKSGTSVPAVNPNIPGPTETVSQQSGQSWQNSENQKPQQESELFLSNPFEKPKKKGKGCFSMLKSWFSFE